METVNKFLIGLSILIFMLSFTIAYCFGQENQYVSEINNIIPPSPTASSLGKYAEVPVSLYTGVPNINIPIYEIKGRKVNVPISLSYHASGVQVSEGPSWVGQGWTLNAGGAITSVIHNMADWKIFNSGNTRQSIPDTLIHFDHNYPGTFLYNVKENIIDVEPDIFYYNFNGYTGSFTTDTSGNPVIIEHNELKVTPDWQNNKFTIITDDGTKYFFDQYEEIHNDNHCDNITPSQDYIPNTWYLTSIISADKSDTVYMEYENTNGWYPSKTSESVKLEWKEFNDVVSYGRDKIQKCLNDIDIKGKELKRITTSNYKVEFFSSGNLPFNQLDSIYIFSHNGVGNFEQLKKYTFSYSYFNHLDCENTSTFLCKRLRLDRVTETSLLDNDVSIPPYTFEYNETPLPPRDSYAQDEWGYYNGANDNESFIPTVKYYNGLHPLFAVPPAGFTNFDYYFTNYFSTYGPDVFDTAYYSPPIAWIPPDNYCNTYMGANRNPDTTYLFAGILKKINYPTGGYTSFDYESNDFGYLPGGKGYDQDQIGYRKLFYEEYTDAISLSSCPEGLDADTTSFNIEFDHVVKIAFNFRGLNPNQISSGFSKVKIRRTDHPGYSWEKEFKECVINNNPCSNTGYFWTTLDSGSYELIAVQRTSGVGYDELVNISVNYKKDLIVKNTKQGSGVRIKKIIDHDGVNPDNDIVREFRYRIKDAGDTSYRSSGVLVKRNEFLRPFDPLSMFSEISLRVILSGYSLGSLGATQGRSIGYRCVEEIQTGNGKSISYFSSPIEYPDRGITYFPYPPTTSYDWKRGLLLKRLDYNEDGNIVQRIENSYNNMDDTLNRTEIEGFKCSAEYDWQDKEVPYFIKYKILSAWNYLKSTKTTTFDIAGEDSITTSTEYFYDNPEHSQLTRIIEFNSDSSEYVTKMEYPLDTPQISNTSQQVMQSMVADNMINSVLRQTVKKDSELIEGQIFNYDYKHSSTDPVLRKSIEVLEGEMYNRKLQFEKYDDKNNLIQFRLENDRPTVFTWGYESSFPIAKTINADSSEVAHTSFEFYDANHWSHEDQIITYADAHTGRMVARVYTGNGTPYGPTKDFYLNFSQPISGYKATVWVKGPTSAKLTLNINNDWLYPVKTASAISGVNDWQLLTVEYSSEEIKEFKDEINYLRVFVSNNSVEAAYFDDIRFYPSDAEMTTYTYEPIMGQTSLSLPDNTSTFYEYDDIGRLSVIKDDNKHIINKYEYNYSKIASFTYYPNKIFKDDTVTFTADYINSGYTYQWDFDDGNSSQGNIVNHSYSNAGTYQVSLNVYENTQLLSSSSKTLIVNLLPEDAMVFLSVYPASGVLTEMADVTLFFKTNITGKAEFYNNNTLIDTMYLGECTSCEFTFTELDEGLHDLSIIYKSTCGIDTLTVDDYIVLGPILTVSPDTLLITGIEGTSRFILTIYTGNDDTCSVTTSTSWIDIIDKTEDGFRFDYEENNTGSSRTGSISVSASTLTPVSIHVDQDIPPQGPYADFTYEFLNQNSLKFMDASTGSPISYSWDFGDGASPQTSTSSNQIVTYSTGGTKTISLTVTYSSDPQSTESKTIHIPY